MRDGFRIFDIDRHVYEPLSLWPEYLDPRFRSFAPSFAYLDRGELGQWPPATELPVRSAGQS